MPFSRLRDEEIVRLRPDVERPEPTSQPMAVELETEMQPGGQAQDGVALFLVGSECRFRCVMCDLWKYTHEGPTQVGSIPEQIESALSTLGDRDLRWIKLYNASNFFSQTNVPKQDLGRIAALLSRFERVIVENHPKLLSDSILDFRDRVDGQLEIAMGLESIHPQVMPLLNKRMTCEDFRHACEWLKGRALDLRAFVLLQPPGLFGQAAVESCLETIDFAADCKVDHISVVPTRSGNGALEYLTELRQFSLPDMQEFEHVMRSRVEETNYVLTADLWDWEKITGACEHCREPRRSAMHKMNLTQRVAVSESSLCNCTPNP
ncbi:MAG: radical SAM protein [Planctomycetota bacterium]